MNPSNLVALVTLDTAGWLNGKRKGRSFSKANKAHEELLNIVRRWQKPVMGESRLPIALRKALVEAINQWSSHAVDMASSALKRVDRSGADYLDEFLDWNDKVVRRRIRFASLPPGLHGLFVSFFDLPRLRKLDPQQQAAVVRSINLNTALSSTAIELQYAIEDQRGSEIPALTAEKKALERKANNADRQLSAEARAFRTAFVATASGLAHHLSLNILEVPEKAGAKAMRSLAQGLQEAGQHLVQPFPLHPRSSERALRTARLGWRRAEDAGALLRVLAAWLRAMVEAPHGAKCPLCYRYRKEDARRFCSVHQRESGRRREAPELHKARLFKLELQQALANDPRTRALASHWTEPALDADSTRAHARAYGVRAELVPPAALLATTLIELLPMLEPGLCDTVSVHFGNVLKAAAMAFDDPRTSDTGARYMRTMHMTEAPEWLGWGTFVKSWFGEALEAPWLESPMKGGGFDAAHPATRGDPVAPTTVAMDLLQQRTWTQADQRLESEGYVSRVSVTKMLSTAQNARGRSKKVTNAELAKKLEVSEETARQARHLAAAPGGMQRRKRLPPQRMKNLFGP